VDLSRLLPGAFCTHILRELGAVVTKIEPPGGDPLRRLSPLAADGQSVFHHLLNQGKDTIVVDTRTVEGRAALDARLAEADVLVDNARASTAKRLTLDRDSVRASHPRLVHCAITGYGQDGPEADRAGHDLNFVAETGLLSFDVTGRREPSLPRMFIADVGGGAMSGVIGILAALLARGRTGEGAFVDISMHHASLYWLMLPAARLLVRGVPADAPDLPTDGSFACYNVYECADGKWIALGALEQKFWAGFCERLGHPEWAGHQYDAAAQPAIVERVREIIRAEPQGAWVDRFAGADLCLSAVSSPGEALAASVALLEDAGGALRIRAPFLPS
jgi:crotonobetainyl-CoA:carnitine CoA-transferase CaiB-like acyl-CoA transferase